MLSTAPPAAVTSTVGGALIYSQPPPLPQQQTHPMPALPASQIPVVLPYTGPSQNAYGTNFAQYRPESIPSPFLTATPCAQEPQQQRRVLPLDLTFSAPAPAVPAGKPTVSFVGPPFTVEGNAKAQPTISSQTDVTKAEAEGGAEVQRKKRAVTVAATAESSQLKAQVRVLEHEVKLLRDGLAQTARGGGGGDSEAERKARQLHQYKQAHAPSPTTAAANEETGKPEIAFGRRVQSSSPSSLSYRMPYSATKTATTRSLPRRRAVSAAASGERTTAAGQPRPQATATLQQSQTGGAPSTGLTNRTPNMQPVMVPVWGESREIPLQGSAAGSTLLPGPSACPSPAANAAASSPSQSKYYWLSADPINLSRNARKAAPQAQGQQPPPQRMSEDATIVQLSPSASADVGSLSSHAAASASAPADELRAAKEEIAALKETTRNQEKSLLAMAAALVEMEQQVDGSCAKVPAASTVAPPIAAGTAAGAASVAGSSTLAALGGASGESEDHKERQREAVILSLARRLADSQKKESDERTHRGEVESALGEKTAECAKLQLAVDTLRAENARLVGIAGPSSSSPTAVATLVTPPSCPSPSSSSAGAAPSHAVVAELKQQVETLTRKLKAWERWFFTAKSGGKGTPEENVERREGGTEDAVRVAGGIADKGDSTSDPSWPPRAAGTHRFVPQSRQDCHDDLAFQSFYTVGHPSREVKSKAVLDAEKTDPLAYLRSWRRYLTLDEDEHVGSLKMRKAQTEPPPLREENPLDSAKEHTKDNTATPRERERDHSEAVAPRTASLTPEVENLLTHALANHSDVTAFLAKGRALRELAAAEHDIAEERLSRYRRREEEPSGTAEEKK